MLADSLSLALVECSLTRLLMSSWPGGGFGALVHAHSTLSTQDPKPQTDPPMPPCLDSQMAKEGIAPNLVTYHALLKVCKKAGAIERALMTFEEIEER